MSLIEAARAVRENAHVPYSNFKVGAAIQAASGTVYVGCNVENVAYPEGTCAEAGAIAAMCAAGERNIAEITVVAGSPRPDFIDVSLGGDLQVAHRAGLADLRDLFTRIAQHVAQDLLCMLAQQR